MSTQLNIKIVQYHWGELNHSYSVNRQINEAYCRRHGYEYVLKTFLPRDDRACCWSKIPAMREELHDCDFLLYLDADAFFYSHELQVEEELIPLLGSKQLMMSANCTGEKDRFQPDRPNTGVLLVRNTEKAAELLRVWDEASENPGLSELRLAMEPEQEACVRTIWKEHADDIKLLKDYYLMNGVNGMFIRHLMEMPDVQRFKIQRQFQENRRQAIQISEEQAIVCTQNSQKQWRWGIGMLSTTYRTDGSLARALESYRGTGFDPPIVFTDLDRRGGLWNLYRAMKTLVKKYPDADAYMIAEDDILFAKEIRKYLESELWPSVNEHGCICSIFTPTIYSSDKRWRVVNHGSKTWMSQCRIYHPLSAKKLVADLENDLRLQNSGRQNDAVIGEWAKNNKVDICFHNPSLIQHVSSKSTSYGTNRSLNYRLGMSRDFVGENRSIREYWNEFGTEPRKVRFLPKLEVVCDGICPKNGTKFQFTPEMARNLADKLDRYNCDIGELSFVGDEPLTWQYSRQCAHKLRVTGKVLRTKMTTSLTKEVDLKPYELLFDAIDIVCNEATKQHLFATYVAGNSFYTVLPTNHEASACRNIPRLFGDDVFLCPGKWHRMIVGSAPMSENLYTRRWTLDEFFHNLDEVLAELTTQESCESSPEFLEEVRS